MRSNNDWSASFIVQFLTLSMCIVYLNGEENVGEDSSMVKTKRQINSLPLVFPYGGSNKFIIGIGVPIKFKEKYSMTFGMNFQYQYVHFQNITEISQYYFIKDVAREEREAEWDMRVDERLVFYQALENLLDSKGMNGEHCLLRAICEAAQYPVDHEGLVGEVIHILLTPDYGKTQLDMDPDWRYNMASYLDAATAGRQMFSCSSIYEGCPEGEEVLELMSLLKEE